VSRVYKITALKIGAAAFSLALFASTLYALVLRPDSNDADKLLEESLSVLAGLNFSYQGDCAGCSEPVRAEFVPGRSKLTSPDARDDWAYTLAIGERGYVSENGRRWIEIDYAAVRMSFADPRFLGSIVERARFAGDEVVNGRETQIVDAPLDVNAFLETLPASFRSAEDDASLREAMEGASATFWIDQNDRRIVQFALKSPDGDGLPIQLDFETPADVPASPESMPADEADRLGQEAEVRGTILLQAIGRYYELHGSYPSTLDPSTVADVLDPMDWPANAFTASPMRNSTEAGDFEYVVLDGGANCELTVHSWYLVQMYYNSERFGPIHVGP